MKKFNKLGLLCVIIMLITVLAITASFSWFTRPYGEKNAHSLFLEGVTAVVKSQDCTVVTYASSMQNGVLVTEDTSVDTANTFTIPASGVQYFTTTVTNNSASDTNISLMNLSLNNAENTTINLLSPIKTTLQYQNNMTFANHLKVEANKTLNVEWYIYNSGSSDITVSFRDLPQISYNK